MNGIKEQIIAKLVETIDEKKKDADASVEAIIAKLNAAQELSGEETDELSDAMKAILPRALYDIITEITYAETSVPAEGEDDQVIDTGFWSWISNIHNYLQSVSNWQKSIQACLVSEEITDLQVLRTRIKAIPAPADPPSSAPVSIISRLFFKESENQ